MTRLQNIFKPVEQKRVHFQEAEILAVRLEGGEIYVPLRPICQSLGLNWSGQTQKLNRDNVLSKYIKLVAVTHTDIKPGSKKPKQSNMLALPLDYLNGWLFKLSPSRIANDDVRARIEQFQERCHHVLTEAFREGRLVADDNFDALLQQDTPATRAYMMIEAMRKMARQQVLLEARIDSAETDIQSHAVRLDALEAKFNAPDHIVTEAQASQVAAAVKAIAMHWSKQSGKNQYGATYGRLYEQFGITSYKRLPAAKFEDAMNWLNSWFRDLAEREDAPF